MRPLLPNPFYHDALRPWGTEFFWGLADTLLAATGVSKGTLMGFPCLRVNGEFFATCDHRTGDLIVKLPAARTKERIAEGVGAPFAPAGRVFREWVLVSERDTQRWKALPTEGKTVMRNLAVLTFLTLDGVMQAPAQPGEDRSGGFTQGGWPANYWNEVMEQVMEEAMAAPYDLLDSASFC